MRLFGTLLLFLGLITAFLTKGVAAYHWDPAGDTIALLVGLFIAYIGICAFIGWFSRRGEDYD